MRHSNLKKNMDFRGQARLQMKHNRVQVNDGKIPPHTFALLCGSRPPIRWPSLGPTMPASPSPPHKAARPTIAQGEGPLHHRTVHTA